MMQKNVLMRQKSLDSSQSKTAMKVLEKYCRKKYRHSTLIHEVSTECEHDHDMTPEPLSPTGPLSAPFGAQSTYRFSHLPSPTIERPQSLFISPQGDTGSKTALSPRVVSELFEAPIKEEIKQRPRETFLSHLWRVIKFLYRRFRLRYIVILLVVISYSLAGGGLFYYFEAPEEVKRYERHRITVDQRHRSFAQCFCLNNCPKYLQPSYRMSNNTVLKPGHATPEVCIQKLKKMLNNYDIAAGFEPIGKKVWAWNDYWNSVFFAWSLLTTIGYGNLSCHTLGGRIATIVYALFGIPLMLFALNALGKMLFLSVQHIWEQFRAKLRRKTKYLQKKIFLQRVEKLDYGASQEDFLKKTKQELEEIEVSEKEGGSDAEVDIFQTFPMHMALAIVFIYIGICSLIFSFWEDWDYFTAFYFFFISLSTIGLGDEVPRHPHYACAFFVFFVIGLALVSMCVSIMQMRVENQYMAALQLIDEEARNGYGSTLQVAEPETISTELHDSVITPTSIREERPLTIIGAGHPGVKWRRPMMNFQLHATTEDPRQHSQESNPAHTPNSIDSDFGPRSPAVYRMPSTSTLSGVSSTMLSTPPVLNALISRRQSTKKYKQRSLLREESVRSNYHEGYSDGEMTPLTERHGNTAVQFDHQFRPPGSPPLQPHNVNQTVPSRNSVFAAPLSVITEASDEEIREQLQSQRNSKKKESILQQAQENNRHSSAMEASNEKIERL